MYVEVAAKPGSLGPAHVSLTVNAHKTTEAESRDWTAMKELRRLHPGEKDIAQLNGIGDEAWFDANIEKGKIGVGGVLARKGTSEFLLESAVLEYRASADALKKIAKRIADQLP